MFPTISHHGYKTALIVTVTVVLAGHALASSDFAVPPGRQAEPYIMIVGPDQNIWFTEFTGEKLGRMTTSGTITEFSIPGAQSLVGIAAGADGNIWFTDQFTGKIGHVSTAGSQPQFFSLPAGSHPQGITSGPDGNLWFVDQKPNGAFTVGKITTAGQIREFSATKNAGPFQAYAFAAQIAAGPDGNLWFTNPQATATAGNLLGKINTSGTSVTIYSPADTPMGVVSGPDGNLWVTESGHVARITTTGTETEIAATFPASVGITVGADGNIWFTEFGTVANINPSTLVLTEGVTSTFYSFSLEWGITSAPDHNLWFGALNSSNFGQLSTQGQLLNTYAVSNGSGPTWDTLGPDGAIWFTEYYAGKVASMNTSGVITNSFSLPEANTHPEGITTGSDGNLWMLEEVFSTTVGHNVGKVAKVTTGGAITEFSFWTGGRGLWQIISGPDGNLWFPEYNSNFIARVTTGGTLTEFAVPTSGAFAFFITNGPDGNLWFTENGVSQVAKIDPGTGTITEYSIGAAKSPGAIVTGPDGNLWFVENTVTGAVGVINTSGVLLKEIPVSLQGFPEGLIVGSDGALWLAQYYPNSVARVTTAGVVSQVGLTISNAAGNDLAIGSDGKIWVVDAVGGAVSRLSAVGGTGKNFSATHGVAFSGTVASYKDGTPTATSSNFTASIDWGDGTKSAGRVNGPTGGPFTVAGSHTYSSAGSYKVIVGLMDSVDRSTYTASPGKATVQ